MAGPDFIPDSHVSLGDSSPDFVSDAEFDAMQGNSGSAWTQTAKQGLAGAWEGVSGLVGLLMDYNPVNPLASLEDKIAGRPTALDQIGQFNAAHLPTPTEEDRYVRTIGQMVAPGLISGGLGMLGGAAGIEAGGISEALSSQLAPRAIVSNLSAGVGAQAAEDITGNKTIAPLIGALAGGVIPGAVADVASNFAKPLMAATPAEIEGSAALAQKEISGLTADDILAAMNKAPSDKLGAKMSTAELTSNPGMAQLQLELSSQGEGAQILNAQRAAREAERRALIDKMASSQGVSPNALGTELNAAAINYEQGLREGERALWEKFPQDALIPIQPQQEELASLLAKKTIGLAPKGDTKKVLGDFLDAGPIASAKDLQDLRSDALFLLREKSLPPRESAALNMLQNATDQAIESGLTKNSPEYQAYLKAREATAARAQMFEPGSVGYSLKNSKPGNALANAFLGDEESASQLLSILKENQGLTEKTKRGILDLIKTDAAGNLTPAKMKQYISSYGEGFKKFFGEEHYSSLKRIYDDLVSEGSVKDLAYGASKGNSVTAQKGTVASVLSSYINESVAPGWGPLGKVFEVVRQQAGIKNAAQVKSLLVKAAFDPEIALKLAQAPTRERVFDAAMSIKELLQNAMSSAGSSSLLDLARPDLANRNTLGLPVNNQRLGSSSYGSMPEIAQPQRGEKQGSLMQPLLPAPNKQEKGAQKKLDSSYLHPSGFSLLDQGGSGFASLSAAVERVESAGNANAVSPKGAVGLMQITPIAMREIMRRNGLADSNYSDEQLRSYARDPEVNKHFGEEYLRLMLDKYEDPRLSLAAYNAGPGLVDRLLKKSDSDSFADIAAKLPRETQKYVVKVEDVFNSIVSA